MKKKIITAFAIAAFVMGGTLISPNSLDNTIQAKVAAPQETMDCTWSDSSDDCPIPKKAGGCDC